MVDCVIVYYFRYICKHFQCYLNLILHFPCTSTTLDFLKLHEHLFIKLQKWKIFREF